MKNGFSFTMFIGVFILLSCNTVSTGPEVSPITNDVPRVVMSYRDGTLSTIETRVIEDGRIKSLTVTNADDDFLFRQENIYTGDTLKVKVWTTKQ